MANTSQIENYPGFENISGFDLAMKMESQMKRAGAEFLRKEVTGVHLAGDIKEISLRDVKLSAPGIIIASGAQRRKLSCIGEDKFMGRGVSYCATCDGSFFKERTVAVVGGGNTAFEDARYLANLCEKVYLIHRRAGFRASEAMQRMVFEKQNIEIITDYVVREISGINAVDTLAITHVKTGEVRKIPVSGVFAAIGMVPESKLYEGQLKLNEAGYISTDENLATNIPGVFAAGDIRQKPLYQIATAVSDGALAAKSLSEYLALRGA